MPPRQSLAAWSDAIYRVFVEERICQVPYVPDAGHSRLIERCHADRRMKPVVLTTEEEGIGVLAGAWLGGERGALLMQSSGVGNCINILSLATVCRFPLLMLVTMRGEWGEFNPWQVPMGRAAASILEQAGVLVYRIDDAGAAAETVQAGARMAFDSARAVAVLIAQRVVGTKSFKEGGRRMAKSARTRPLERRAVVKALVANREDMLVVTGLGSTTYDVAAAGDDARNFYLWGAMGAAALIGLGLALAQPKRRVLVITGDGEMLMGMGGLATIGVARPRNLAVAVIDNERYAETGLQRTHTAHGFDLCGVAEAAGFPVVLRVDDGAGLAKAIPLLHAAAGPVFAAVKVAPDRLPFVLPSRDGVELKNRFRAAVLGRAGAG